MDGKNQYTAEDIDKLEDLWSDKTLGPFTFPDAFYDRDTDYLPIVNSHITRFGNPSEYLKRIIFSNNFSGMRRKGINEDLCDIYAFIFYVRIEDVPLHINSPILKEWKLVQWRLMIGK